MARAIRPLPSSNGCNVTNHKWASPALISSGSLDDPLAQRQSADVDADVAGKGRTHGLDIEPFALNFAGLDHVFGECRQAGLVAQGHADIA